MIKSFDELRMQTRSRINSRQIPRVGIFCPEDNKFLDAAYRAHKDGYVVPYLLGPTDFIKQEINESDIDIGEYELIECESIESAIKTGIEMVDKGELDFLMKGFFGNHKLAKIIRNPEIGFAQNGRPLSHVGIVETSRYPKLMYITDAAVNSTMDPNTLVGIARNAAELARSLGVETPKAALLAAVEAIYPQVPVTMMEAAIAKMSDRGQIKGVDIDGPLSFDVAINKEVALSKGITNSKVAGETDIFVCPNIETANGLYKAMLMYALAESASVVVGGKCPMVSNFVLDCTECVINSLVLGSYLAMEE